MSLTRQIGAYMALISARLRLEATPLKVVLDDLSVHPIAMDPAHLERLLERGRLRYPGFTCLHAALVFRQLKDVRICLGVNPFDVAEGHAWVEDDEGKTWLQGPPLWQQIWKEE